MRTALTLALLLGSTAAGAFELHLTTDGDEDLRGQIRGVSALANADENGIDDPDEIIAAVQSDYRSILGALYREGYYGPSISIKVDGREGSSIPLISLPDNVNSVAITVEKGPRFSFGRTEVSPLAPDTDLPDGFATGETARAPLVGAARDAAIDGWRAVSHAKAEMVTQSVIADHPERRLDVAIGIDPGPRVTFGTLLVAGETIVSERRVRKIAGLPEGGAYSPEDLDLVANRLQRTGAFRSVTLTEARTLGEGNTLDITAKVVDETPRRFGFGAELSSLEGGTLSAYWMHRNLTANADRLRFDGEISGLGGSTGIDVSLSASYRRPATFHAKYTALLGAQIEHINDPGYRANTGEFSFGVEVEASRLSQVTASIGYRYSDVSDAFGNRSFHHIIFPVAGERDMRDDALDTKHGTYAAAEIMPFVGLSGSQSGVRVTSDFRGYLSFGEDDRVTLAGRVQTGSVFGANTGDVPPDFLFFSGGGGSVRGQPYQSLGIPVGGSFAGGRGMFAFSTELRAMVTDKIGVVGFADLGAIGTDPIPTRGATWHAGAGLGVRYHTGFGPIRLDLALPVSGTTGDGLQLYVGIGQAF
ncbi:autotransporter assembly complex protein TamA [Celeribacter sp.]|uniref:autotransporter assembly complex protein TamA n=1 Tax=Celeribacter sp. TaxID=1890673 RepID=UPI003A8F395A